MRCEQLVDRTIQRAKNARFVPLQMLNLPDKYLYLYSKI